MLVLANSLCLLVEIKNNSPWQPGGIQGAELQKHVVQRASGLGCSRWKMTIVSPDIVFAIFSGSKAEIC